jgi:hypothetical protein
MPPTDSLLAKGLLEPDTASILGRNLEKFSLTPSEEVISVNNTMHLVGKFVEHDNLPSTQARSPPKTTTITRHVTDFKVV